MEEDWPRIFHLPIEFHLPSLEYLHTGAGALPGVKVIRLTLSPLHILSFAALQEYVERARAPGNQMRVEFKLVPSLDSYGSLDNFEANHASGSDDMELRRHEVVNPPHTLHRSIPLQRRPPPPTRRLRSTNFGREPP